jgi:hypothetical protein
MSVGQFRRLADLEDDIRYRFSIGGVKNRHPSPRVRQLINVAWQQLRSIVSLANDGTFLQATAILALPTVAAVTGEVYAEVDFPVDAVSVYGVRVQRAATGEWFPLKRIPWAAYQDFQYQGIWSGYAGQPMPCAFCAREIPKGVETVATAGKVMIVPVPTGGNYRLWYMEAWVPQVDDDDLLSGQEEFFEWVIYSVMIKMLGPDADSKKMYPIWSEERREARSLIEARANRFEDGMALEPRDARNDGYERYGYGGEL